MSTHNICFSAEIRKLFFCLLLLSGAMACLYSEIGKPMGVYCESNTYTYILLNCGLK